MSAHRLSAIVAASLLGLGTAAACFSERVASNGTTCVVPADSTPGGSPIIRIVDFEFLPAAACITPGTTVTWRNDGAQIHSTSADLGDWDSPLLSPGATFTHTFAAAGDVDYHCAPHPFMQATVVVQ